MSTEGFDPISLLVIVIFTALNDVKQIVALRKRFSVRNHFIKLINIHYILGKLFNFDKRPAFNRYFHGFITYPLKVIGVVNK